MNPRNVLHFPELVGSIVLQLIYFTLTETETFLMVASCTFLGFLLGWQWGVAIFLVSYTVVRLIGGYVSLLASKLHLIAHSNASVRGKETE